MPNETQQPLGEQLIRSKDDTKLVADVLGSEAADEMSELVGGQVEEPTVAPNEIKLSAGEQASATEAEKTKAEMRRDEYITWAGTFSKDKNWVDETFIFESDGRVRVEGDLDLSNTNISELPPTLYRVEGELDLAGNQITKIANIPEAVTWLYLGNNQITKIENIPESVTALYLFANKITKIENIPETVTWLDLGDNQITKIENIPESVTTLNLSDNKIAKKENIPDSVVRINLANNPIESS